MGTTCSGCCRDDTSKNQAISLKNLKPSDTQFGDIICKPTLYTSDLTIGAEEKEQVHEMATPQVGVYVGLKHVIVRVKDPKRPNIAILERQSIFDRAWDGWNLLQQGSKTCGLMAVDKFNSQEEIAWNDRISNDRAFCDECLKAASSPLDNSMKLVQKRPHKEF